MAELKIEKARYLNEAETADYLGASFNMFKQLHRSGLLEPRTGPLKRKHKGFDRVELDRFLTRVFAGAKYCPTEPPGAVDVALATRKVKCSTPDVLRLVLDGRIEAVGRLSKGYELRGLLVHVDQVISALTPDRSNGYPLGPICRELYLDRRTVKGLIEEGFLMAERRKRATTRVTNVLVTEQSVKAFRATFCSLGTLRFHWPGLRSLQHSDLKALGVAPIDLCRGTRRIYRLCETPGDLEQQLPVHRREKRGTKPGGTRTP